MSKKSSNYHIKQLSERISDQADLWQKALDNHRSGQLLLAEQNCLAILKRDAQHLGALNLLGTLCAARGDKAEAHKWLQTALSIAPTNSAVLVNYANWLLNNGEAAQATTYFSDALESNPKNISALCGRGRAHYELGQLDDATDDYHGAIQLEPKAWQALYGLALIEVRNHHYDSALTLLKQCLAINPHSEILSLYAHTLFKKGDLSASIQAFDRLLVLNPNNRQARYNKALLLTLQGQQELALPILKGLWVESPDMPQLAGWLAFTQAQLADWSGLKELLSRIEHFILYKKQAIEPFHLLPFFDDALLLKTNAQLFSAKNYDDSVLVENSLSASKSDDQKIHIAYVSADFYNHATTVLLTELIEQHDRERFVIHGYSIEPSGADVYAQRIRQAFDHFYEVANWSNAQIIEHARKQGIDIAVDLKGHTQGARASLFAQRMAPVQVSYLGYPGTTGMAQMDYMFADEQTIPVGDESFYTERIIRLPHSYQCNDTQRPIDANIPSRIKLGLPDDAFVFCCFNNSYKITPEIWDVWCELLRQIPDSVLWLLSDHPIMQENLQREATVRGVLAQRLIFSSRKPLPQYLAQMRQADLPSN